jgi:hypothetical protein
MDALIALALGAALGGFASGLAGFAYGLSAYALWAWFLGPDQTTFAAAAGSVLAQCLTIGRIALRPYWRDLAWFLPAGLMAVPLGVALAELVDDRVFKIATGCLIAAFGAIGLIGRMPRMGTAGGRIADAAAGALGGLAGGLAGLSGPIPVLWLLARGWEKARQRAVIQAFNLAILLATVIALAASRPAAAFALVELVALLLPTGLAALAGQRLYDRVPEQAFRRVLLTILLLSGAALAATTAWRG